MHSLSPEQTEGWGERLGRNLQQGDLVTCSGPLGAGKTTLIRGICRGLGIDESEVSSPTFILMQVYQGRLPVYHFDAYRLSGPSQLEEIGAEEYFQGDGVCLLEWPDRAEGLLPDDRLEVQLELTDHPDQRQLTVSPTGPRARQLAESL